MASTLESELEGVSSGIRLLLSQDPMFGPVSVTKQTDWTLMGMGSWNGEGRVRVRISYGKDPGEGEKPAEKGVMHVILYREGENGNGLQTICHVTLRRTGLLRQWKFDRLVESEVGKAVRMNEWEDNLEGLFSHKDAEKWLKWIEEYYECFE